MNKSDPKCGVFPTTPFEAVWCACEFLSNYSGTIPKPGGHVYSSLFTYWHVLTRGGEENGKGKETEKRGERERSTFKH